MSRDHVSRAILVLEPHSDANETNRTLGFEAAGSVQPKLRCGPTERNSTVGDGTGCLALQTSIAANFTSLSPRPK
jgi:hypothetical protein